MESTQRSSARAVEVDRPWRRAVWWVHGRIFWRWWGVAEASDLATAYLTFLILFSEPVPWPLSLRTAWMDHPVVREIGLASSLSLLLLLPLFGWLVDGALELQHPPGLSPRPWLRALRFSCASLPVLNLYVFPLWRLLVEHQPGWGFVERRPQRLQLEAAARRDPWRRVRGWRNRLLGSGWFAAWLAVSFLVPLWWTVCVTSALAHADRRALLWSFVAGLHLAAFGAAMLSLRHRLPPLSAGRALTARLLPWLWLLPLPGPVVGYLVLNLATLSGMDDRLVAQVYGWRGQLGRQPDWRAVQTEVHRRWRGLPWWRRRFTRAGEQQFPVAGRAQRQLQAFYRLKTLLLVLDVTALVTVLSLPMRRWPAIGSAFDRLILGGAVGALLLMTVGLVMLGVALAARWFRVPDLETKLAQRPWGRALLVTQTATLAGLCLGHWLARDRAQILVLFALATVLGVTVAVLFSMVLVVGGPLRDWDPLDLIWAPAILAMTLPVALAAGDEAAGATLRRLLVAGMLLLPVWHLLLGATLGRWMLYPHQWRDRASHPSVARLGAVAVLPLGGWLLPRVIATRGVRRLKRGEPSAVLPNSRRVTQV